jgi:hypothetical protein
LKWPSNLILTNVMSFLDTNKKTFPIMDCWLDIGKYI